MEFLFQLTAAILRAKCDSKIETQFWNLSFALKSRFAIRNEFQILHGGSTLKWRLLDFEFFHLQEELRTEVNFMNNTYVVAQIRVARMNV